jgi:hypothetical protein
MHRRLIALVAAYAVALQAVVASFAMASVIDGVPALCTSSAPQTPAPDPWHALPCIACPAVCEGGPPGLAPGGVFIALPRDAAVRFEHGLLRLAERSAPRNLPPSRAPPTA